MLVVSVRLAAGVQRHRHPWFESEPWKELIGMVGLVGDNPFASNLALHVEVGG